MGRRLADIALQDRMAMVLLGLTVMVYQMGIIYRQ